VNGSANQFWTACVLKPARDINSKEIFLLRHISANPTHRLQGHTGRLWKLLFSPDGTRLVSCEGHQPSRLWDVPAGKEIAQLPAPMSGHFLLGGPRGEFVDFSPNGEWLATSDDYTISFRDARNGIEKVAWRPPGGGPPSSLCFAHDSKTLFTFPGVLLEYEGKKIAFMQFRFLASLPKALYFEGDRKAVDGLISPNEKHVITWNGSPAVTIWDIETRKEIHVLNVAPNKLYDIALSPTGTVLATAGDDDEVKLWDMKTHAQVKTEKLFRHEGVDGVQFSTDGKYLVTYNGDDGWLKVWDAPAIARDPLRSGTLQKPVHVEVRSDGTVRREWPDGHITYGQAASDK
jgi:WD40 repeat protein